MNARILINDTASVGNFPKSFILQLYDMGAQITVFIGGEAYLMEECYAEIKAYKDK